MSDGAFVGGVTVTSADIDACEDGGVDGTVVRVEASAETACGIPSISSPPPQYTAHGGTLSPASSSLPPSLSPARKLSNFILFLFSSLWRLRRANTNTITKMQQHTRRVRSRKHHRLTQLLLESSSSSVAMSPSP